MEHIRNSTNSGLRPSKHHIGLYPSPTGVLAKFPKDLHRLWVLGIDIGCYMTIIQVSGIE